MFAVIKTGGKQYRAQEGDVLNVEKLAVESGKEVTFDQVLLIEDKGKAMIGTPLIKNAVVKATVIENFRDKKVIVFKKKRRKQYKKKQGHRQELTKVQIEKIIFGKETAPKKKPAEKKEGAAPAIKKKPALKKAEPKAEKTKQAAAPAPKKTAKPKAAPAAKKPAAKKPAAKKPATKKAAVKEK